MSPRQEDTPEDLLKQESKQSLIREILDLRAQVETLTAERHAWKAQAESDQADLVAAAQRNLSLIVAREASDTARASAEAALAEIATHVLTMHQSARAESLYVGAGKSTRLPDTEDAQIGPMTRKLLNLARAALEQKP